MTSWRDLLAALSIMLDQVPRRWLTLYGGIVGWLFSFMVLSRAAAIEEKAGLGYALVYVAGVSTLMAVAASKALRRRR